jgi:P-type Cu+ transporter
MQQNHTYKIKGMHCASCAVIIEKILKKSEGVESVEVNYGTETVKIIFDELKTNTANFAQGIEKFGYSLVIPDAQKTFDVRGGSAVREGDFTQSRKEKLAEVVKIKSKVLSVIPLAVFSIFVMGWDIFAQYNIVPEMNYMVKGFVHHLLPICATYALCVFGKPYLFGVYRFLRYGKANMDTLIGIGTGTAFLYSFVLTAFEESLRPFIAVEHTYYDVTIVVITFVALGRYLEARSKIKTGDAIEELLHLQAKKALVIREKKEIEVSVEEVRHGDVIIVKPGAKIPVDGVVTEGGSFVDESMISGESMPVQKEIGSSVLAGTINMSGSFMYIATRVGAETLLAQIVKMVEEAQGTKAPIQARADKISSVFVPIVLTISFLSLALWLSVGTQYLGFSQAFSYGLVSFVGVLIIACPCALGLATPTAIIVGVGKGAKEGILIKDAGALEKLHKIDILVLDKTGTLTKGKPTLTDIQNFSDFGNEKFISILASLEKKSEHPIAHAIVSYVENLIRVEKGGIVLSDVSNFQGIQGKGVKGFLNGEEYFAGSTNLIKDLDITFDVSKIEVYTAQGKTPVILATKAKVLGFVMVADEIKAESKQAVANLHKLGIKVVMLTGDDAKTAQYIASLVGISEVVARLLPQDKLAKIKELQLQGKIVAMAGDGVNDAPALAQADVGIAMGTGTDVAIESAGVTLLGGDISKLVKVINLSKITMRGIKQNLFWAFVYNIIGIPLAAGAFYPIFGWLLNPVFAGFAMALSSVSVVSNSLRIKAQKI